MKRYAFLLFTFVLTGLTKTTTAQYYFYNDSYYDSPIVFEVGGSFGAFNSLTDIGGKKGIGGKFTKDLTMGTTEIGGGVYFSALYKNAIALRLEGAFTKLAANDNVLAGVTDIARERYNRNLNFRTSISEFSVLTEWHPLFLFIDWETKDQDPPRYSPYLLAGVGFFSFNPQGQLGNRWIDLQPLRTEGQGFDEYPDRKVYKLQQTNIPLGLGIKYELSPILNLRGEFVYRKLFTDYLDDVSTSYIDPALFQSYLSGSTLRDALAMNDRQLVNKNGPQGGAKRGGANQKDAYFSFNIKLGLLIGRQKVRY